MGGGLEPFAETVHGAVVAGVRGGHGPTALLLHGTAGSWRNFRPWLPALQTRCLLVAPDVPGFGESPAPDLAPTLFFLGASPPAPQGSREATIIALAELISWVTFAGGWRSGA